MNGETINRDQGYPLRVIVPDVISAHSVKKLASIKITDEECQGFFMQMDSEIFPPSVNRNNIDWSTRQPQIDFPYQSVICSLERFGVYVPSKDQDSGLKTFDTFSSSMMFPYRTPSDVYLYITLAEGSRNKDYLENKVMSEQGRKFGLIDEIVSSKELLEVALNKTSVSADRLALPVPEGLFKEELGSEDFPTDWSDLTESQLQKLCLNTLDVIFKSASKKIIAYDYVEVNATKAILRVVPCYGCKDTKFCIEASALMLVDKGVARSAIPSGASTSIYDTIELRDGSSDYLGKGVLKAVANDNTIIVPTLIGRDPTNQTGINNFMVQQLDGTVNEWDWCKQKLGANAILAVHKTGARVKKIQHFFLSSFKPVLCFAIDRTINKEAMTHPGAAANGSLIADQNRSISTLAITTLLKTGNEFRVARLTKQITDFVSIITGGLTTLAAMEIIPIDEMKLTSVDMNPYTEPYEEEEYNQKDENNTVDVKNDELGSGYSNPGTGESVAIGYGGVGMYLKTNWEEVEEGPGEEILFIDEIHFVLGAARTEIDAANLFKRMLVIQRNEGSTAANSMLIATDGPDQITEKVSHWTGIIVTRLGQYKKKILFNIIDRAHKRVVGQDQAVESVTEAVAEQLVDDAHLLARIDMSEYMEPHYVSRVEGGQLIKDVRRPCSVVLFDNVAIAHATVRNALSAMLVCMLVYAYSAMFSILVDKDLAKRRAMSRSTI